MNINNEILTDYNIQIRHMLIVSAYLISFVNWQT